MFRLSARRSLVLGLAVLTIGIALVPATLQAGVTVYSSRSAFEAAASGLTNLDFEGLAAIGSYVSYGTGPLVLSGVSITGNNSMFVIDPGFYGFPYPSAFLNSDYSVPDILTFALPGSYTAVGFDFGSLFSGGASFDVQLDGMGPFTVTSTGSTQDGVLGFAGFISSTAFSTVTLTMPDAPNYNAIDNFEFGSGGTVPEPASLLLLGSGIVAVARRLKAKKA